MIHIMLLAAAASAGLPVQVQGNSRCPSPSEVAAILPELLPITNDPRPDTAWIETAGLDLSITLRDPDGNTMLSRRITSHGTCADLANAAAVVIATAVSERNPELSLLQPGVAPPAPVKAAPPPPNPPAADVAAQRPQPPATAPRLALELGGGGGASLNGGGWVTSGRVEVGVRRGRLGLRVSFAGDTERQQTMESGQASWRRMAVGIGPSVVVVDHPMLTLDVHAQFLAGITTVRGQGFMVDRQSRGFSPGFASGLRLGMGDGRVRPWLDASGQVWLAPEVITVDASPVNAQLPRMDLRLLLGFSVSLVR